MHPHFWQNNRHLWRNADAELAPHYSVARSHLRVRSGAAVRSREILCDEWPLNVLSPAARLREIEALARPEGTQSLESGWGYLPELVREGETGFLVDTVKEAAAAVERLGKLDPRACHANVQARFSVQVMAAGYERAFRRVIGGED